MEDKNLQIEKIAWERFQTSTGLHFKRDITPEERKSILELPVSQPYLDQALEIYNQRQLKKEKAVFATKYPVIQVPSSGNRTWVGGARAMFFVYSRDKGNFILEGYSKEVEEYLQTNYTHYFYRYTYWHNGQSRGSWKFWKESVGIIEPSKHRKEWKYTIRKWTGGYRNVSIEESNKTALKLKRLPKRWIPEFNKL